MPPEPARLRFDPGALIPYLPEFVGRRLAAHPEPLSGAERERTLAAVLFADISGFTALAEELGPRGPAGAEELTSRLNACFGQLISLVAEHGGDVVKFAGDALLALWRGTERDLP